MCINNIVAFSPFFAEIFSSKELSEYVLKHVHLDCNGVVLALKSLNDYAMESAAQAVLETLSDAELKRNEALIVEQILHKKYFVQLAGEYLMKRNVVVAESQWKKLLSDDVQEACPLYFKMYPKTDAQVQAIFDKSIDNRKPKVACWIVRNFALVNLTSVLSKIHFKFNLQTRYGLHVSGLHNVLASLSEAQVNAVLNSQDIKKWLSVYNVPSVLMYVLPIIGDRILNVRNCKEETWYIICIL